MHGVREQSAGGSAIEMARPLYARLVTKGKLPKQIPRIALTPPEAAAALGVGESFFNTHISHELRVIRRGRKRLVPVVELERWAEANAEPPVADQLAGTDSPS